MSTAFGILLFVIVYAPIAYLVYRDVTARRAPAQEAPRHAYQPRIAHVERQRRQRPRPQLQG